MFESRSGGNTLHRIVRLIIDIVNVIIGIAVVVLAILAFINTGANMWMFPLIFLLGGIMNTVTGIKYMMTDKFTIGIVAEAVSALLYIVSYVSYTAIGG